MKTCGDCYYSDKGTCSNCKDLPSGATTEISMNFTCDNWKVRPQRTFALGDLHGAHKALLQVFERSGFDKEHDELIVLGDVCDGWTEVRQCFDELLTVKHLVYILGNHDQWALEWMKRDAQPTIWTSQGGKNTMKSYWFDKGQVPKSHIELLENAQVWHVDEEYNRLFVHGGINKDLPIEKQKVDVCLWDRELLQRASKRQLHNPMDPNLKITTFNEIFLGHTTTQMFGNSILPLHFCELWDIDTGAGWSGKLTIMDVDTKYYWQSDFVYTLYPDEKGRG